MKNFITWPITQASAEAHHIIHGPIISHGLLTLDITLVSLLWRCFHSHAIFDSNAIRTKYGPAKNQGRGGEGGTSYKNEGCTHQKIRIKLPKETLIHSMTDYCNLFFIED